MTRVWDFPNFAASVTIGLAKAVASDPDVFSLALAGLLVGSPSRYARGLGMALGGLVAARRADQYVTVLASKLDRLGAVIHEDKYVYTQGVTNE